MRILVARHGQTQWNALNKVCGRTDLPLTELGHAQARELARKLEHEGIDLIIASPMIRARQTAQAVADLCGVPVLVDERLIEQNFGIFEGVDRKDPGFLGNKRHFALRYPGGESMMDVAHRTYSLLEEIKVRYPGKTVLLACHGAVGRVIRTYFEDMTNDEFFHYSPDNAAVMEYEL